MKKITIILMALLFSISMVFAAETKSATPVTEAQVSAVPAKAPVKSVRKAKHHKKTARTAPVATPAAK